MYEALVRDGHWIVRLLEEKNCAACVDLVRRADCLLNHRQVSPRETTSGSSWSDRARDVTTEPSGRPRCCDRGEEGARCWIAGDRNQIVHGLAVKDSKICLTHEPQVQRGYVGVTDEDFWIVPKNFRLEVRQHSHCAVASGSTDHSFDSGIEPHA